MNRCVVDGSRLSMFSYTTSCECVCQLVWLTSRTRLSTAWCRMLGSQVTNKHTGHEPLFLDLYDCIKGTTHSDTLSVFLQLQSWLCIGMSCKRTIFCVLYADTRSDVSDYSDNESLDSDSDVPTTSSHDQLQSCPGPLTPQFPHPFFLTSIETIFITVWD